MYKTEIETHYASGTAKTIPVRSIIAYAEHCAESGRNVIYEMLSDLMPGNNPYIGRNPMHVSHFPSFPELYSKYMTRKIKTKKEFAAILGISRPTLDKLIAEYKAQSEQ